MGELFCGQGNGILVMGQQHDGIIDTHHCHTPWGYKEWRHLIVVRNPYDRFLSMYGHAVHHFKYEGTDLRVFGCDILGGKLGKFFSCISVAFPQLMHIHGTIKVERLKEDLLEYGLITEDQEIPHWNRSEHPMTLTPDEAYLARIWGGDDFNRFQYSEDYDG